MDARTLAAAIALSAAAVAPARADIYTWLDEKGTLNVSNLEPPPGVTVTHVDRSLPQKPPPSALRPAGDTQCSRRMPCDTPRPTSRTPLAKNNPA